jgi:hypothetical protein
LIILYPLGKIHKFIDEIQQKIHFGKMPNYTTFNEGSVAQSLLWVAVDAMNMEKIVW